MLYYFTTSVCSLKVDYLNKLEAVPLLDNTENIIDIKYASLAVNAKVMALMVNEEEN